MMIVLNQGNLSATGGTSKPEDIGTQRIFLSKLFQLIATMCECSGDFFAERFRNDVWPVMARHLEYLLEELQHQRANALRKQERPFTTINSVVSSSLATKGVGFKMSDTQRQLILSILNCLNRILQQEDCGKAVEKLFRVIGSILLPLLDIEDQTKIQELSMDCIRNILRIDSDILRRPLMELGGTRIPSCPLKFGIDLRRRGNEIALLVNEDSSLAESTNTSTLANRCRELLAFANALPEQAIS